MKEAKDKLLSVLFLLVSVFVYDFYSDARTAIADTKDLKRDIKTVDRVESELREVRMELGSIKTHLGDLKNRSCGQTVATRKGP